jgi:YVTN family beta-propeller protein
MRKIKPIKAYRGNTLIIVVGITVLALLMLISSTEATPFAYVTHYNGDTVSVIDVETNSVVKTIQVGPAPRGVAVTPDGTKAYVCNYMGDLSYSPVVSNSVSVINTANNTVIDTLYLGYDWPVDVIANPDGSKMYVLCESGYVVINTENEKVIATIPIGGNNIAITPDGSKLYVTNYSGVSVIDTITNNMSALISTGIDNPYGVAVSPDGTKLYVANYNKGNIIVINSTVYNITATIPVGGGPKGIAFSPDGKRAYVTNSASSTVSAIDTIQNKVNSTLPVGGHPWGIAVNPDGTRAYETSYEGNGVSVLDTVNNTVISTVPISARTVGVAIYNPPMFQPIPNGYMFENFDREIFPTSSFHSIYGLNVNLTNKNSKITKFYLDYFKYMGRGGDCFGMSATSLALYNNEFDNAYDYNKTEETSSALFRCGIPLHGPYPETLDGWITYHQAVQVDKACLSDKIKYKASLDSNRNVFVGFPTVYGELKKRLASNDYSMTLGLFGYVWNNETKESRKAGHCVAPYKIDESPDKQSAKIYVYDCNHPGDFNRYIEVNLNTGKVADYDFMKNIYIIDLCSLEAIKEPAQIPDLTTLRTNIDPAHLLYTDSSGRKLGYDNGVFKDEIPGTCSIIPYSEDTDNNYTLESYYVPNPSIKMELYSTGSGDSEVSMMTPMGLINAYVPVSPTSVDEFKILGNGTGVEFKSENDTTPALDLMLDVETPDHDQVVQANLSQIEANGVLTYQMFMGTSL